MDGKQLKNSILQWAIQGKLVPQNPKDEPAQKLLERIAASRNESSLSLSKGTSSTSLRGAKATKQPKNPPSRIYRENDVWYEQVGTATPKDISDEIPFEIPENWAWARWGELSDSIQYGYNAPALQSGRIKMVRISDIHDNKIEWDKVPYCQIKESEISTYLLQKNDILFARTGGTVGKSYLVSDVTTEAVYAGYLIRTRYNFDLLSPQYLKFFMESSLYWEQLREGTIATAQPNCNGKTLGKMLLPLPPLAEQKRIVAKLEQVLPLAEEYGTAQEQLDKLNKELPEALKKSILQEAIQGKLVPHLKSDGQADEFLKKIAKAKESLIDAGKIKKEKTSAPISDEEKPFDLPNGWSWIRLGDYCERVTDQVASGSFATLRENVKSLKTPSYAIMVKTADFSNNFSRNLTYTDKHGYEFLSNSNLFGGELILSNIGSIGKVFIVPKMDSPMTLAPNSVMLRLMDENCRDYLYYFLLSPFGYAELMNITSGTAMKKFNKTDLKTIVIPVPPLPEQKRIVKKIEELYKVIDSWH